MTKKKLLLSGETKLKAGSADYRIIKVIVILVVSYAEPEYVLQPIGELLPNFYKDDQAAGDEWNRISSVIQRSLFAAIRGAGLDPETVHLLTMSITEGELKILISSYQSHGLK